MSRMVSIDEALLAEASEATGTAEAEQVVREALRALIARENARAAGLRLAAMGGTMPGAWAPNEGDEPPI